MTIQILVVEDDALIRLGAVDELEGRGFDVSEAANAAEALRILARRPGIEVVFTDIEMPPGMDGAALGASVRQYWPRTKMIYTSGKPRPADLASPFFAKPYLCGAIADAARALARG